MNPEKTVISEAPLRAKMDAGNSLIPCRQSEPWTPVYLCQTSALTGSSSARPSRPGRKTDSSETRYVIPYDFVNRYSQLITQLRIREYNENSGIKEDKMSQDIKKSEQQK